MSLHITIITACNILEIEDDIKRKRLYSIWESAILETEKERLLSFYLIPYEVLKNKKIPDADYAMIKKIREDVICAKVGDKNFINAVDAALTAVDNQEAIEKLKTLVARLKGGGNGHGHRRCYLLRLPRHRDAHSGPGEESWYGVA